MSYCLSGKTLHAYNNLNMNSYMGENALSYPTGVEVNRYDSFDEITKCLDSWTKEFTSTKIEYKVKKETNTLAIKIFSLQREEGKKLLSKLKITNPTAEQKFECTQKFPEASLFDHGYSDKIVRYDLKINGTDPTGRPCALKAWSCYDTSKSLYFYNSDKNVYIV